MALAPTPLWKALALAGAAHAGERHDVDGQPFIDHVLAVAGLVSAAGLGEHVVAAALLHDVVEHSDVSIRVVENRFGSDVAALVAALTEPASGPRAARKAAHRRQIAAAGSDAQAIFVADKIALARALRRGLRRVGADGLERRLRTPLTFAWRTTARPLRCSTRSTNDRCSWTFSVRRWRTSIGSCWSTASCGGLAWACRWPDPSS